MKRSNKLFILLGVLIVVCLAAFGMSRYEKKLEQIKNSDEVILELPADSVQALSWETENGSFALHKDEKWLYDEDEAFPVDEETIGEMLARFESFGVSFIIEEVEDYAQYGLDEPVCTINLKTEDAEYKIELGNFSNMDSERYVSIGDGNVYLVQEDPMDSFDVELSDLIDQDEIPSFSGDGKVKGITFAGTEDYEIAWKEESDTGYSADDVYFTSKDGKDKPLDTSLVKAYLTGLSGLGLTDYVTYNATEEEIADYGLDAPDLTVSVAYTDEDEEGNETEETFLLSVGRSTEGKAAAQKAAADGDASEGSDASGDGADSDGEDSEEIPAYVRVGESKIIYEIGEEDYEKLMAASYDDLRHKEALAADFADVYQIAVTLDGEEYLFTSEGDADERTWSYQDEELDISGLQSALEDVSADSFTAETPEKKEEISLTLSLENDNYPEIAISLYRYDGQHCLAVIDGQSTSLVPRSQAVALMEAVYAVVL